MNRCKNACYRGKERKRERGEEDKKRRGKSGIKSQKKKKRKTSPRAGFSSVQSTFLDFGKSNLYLLSFSWKILSMSELGDIRGLNVHPTPIFATAPKFSGSPEDI